MFEFYSSNVSNNSYPKKTSLHSLWFTSSTTFLFTPFECNYSTQNCTIGTIQHIKLRLKKTANVRICVIDLSKVIMCYFHYGYTKFKYGNNSRLLFTDVDSWTYEIKTKDVYEDYSKDNEMLYFSN